MTVAELVEVADISNYLVMSDTTHKLMFSPNSDFIRGLTVEQIAEAMDLPVYRFTIADKETIHIFV